MASNEVIDAQKLILLGSEHDEWKQPERRLAKSLRNDSER